MFGSAKDVTDNDIPEILYRVSAPKIISDEAKFGNEDILAGTPTQNLNEIVSYTPRRFLSSSI